MPHQVPELILSAPDAARALMNVTFLRHFLDPASPSAVARSLGMPANLAHHHARQALRAGVLFEARRDQGKVLYQLAARQFRTPGELDAALGSGQRVFHRMVTRLTTAFLQAYDRSEAAVQRREGRWSITAFITLESERPPVPTDSHSDEARPAFFVQRTVSLTPDAYRRLLSRIDTLIQEEQAHQGESGAAVCTVAALGFEGMAHAGVAEDSLSTSSFFAPIAEGAQ